MKKVNKEPLVSVMMPVYNGSRYVGQAIDSILNQTYRNFELILINDNSSDSTLNILKAYKKRFPKEIKVFNLTSNNGPFRAVNLVLKHAKGDFIAPMDSDDISHPQRLEKEVKFLLENENIILVGTHARIIDSDGRIIGKKVFETKDKEIRRQFFEVHPIVHPSCMIRRSLLPRKNTIYYPEYGINSDYYTTFKLTQFGRFANLNEFLFDYRIHLKNSSLQGLKGNFFNTVKIRWYALTKMGYKPSIISLLKFFTQIMIVSLIPESKLFTIYLINKKIYSPKDVIIGYLQKLNFATKTTPYFPKSS